MYVTQKICHREITLIIGAVCAEDKASHNAYGRHISAVNDIAIIERPGPDIAYVLYVPSAEYQRKKSDLGISGQFVVEYDIDRDSNPGEVLVSMSFFYNSIKNASLLLYTFHSVIIHM